MRKYISYFIMQEKDNTNQNRVFCWSFVYKEVNNSLVLSKGLDPFNQNFWKFWCKTEWIGSVQMESFEKVGQLAVKTVYFLRDSQMFFSLFESGV